MARRPDGDDRFSLSPRARRIAGWLAALLLVLGIAAVVRFLGGNGDGTPLDAELLIEDVAEHEYRIDRAMFHVTGSPSVRRASCIRMGRMSEIPENDPQFGSDAESIVRDWCQRAGIAFLGHADIGHDAANRVVPFKLLSN